MYSYITVPYPGCSKPVACDFCAFHGTGMKGLTPDRPFGLMVTDRVKRNLSKTKPKTLVIFNNGNILHPEEMDPTAILEDIPRAVADDETCQALELEIAIRDLAGDPIWENIGHIRRNLGAKELRMRLSVEYSDDELLGRHHKGTDLRMIETAIARVNRERIPWIGYALLGGMDMTAEEAKAAAIRTGKFIVDRNARMLGVNGIYLTEGMVRRPGVDRIYLPTVDDLIITVRTLSEHARTKDHPPLIKVGLAEEDGGIPIVKYPYVIPMDDEPTRRRMIGVLSDFNGSQNFADFMVGVYQNWAQHEAFRTLRSFIAVARASSDTMFTMKDRNCHEH